MARLSEIDELIVDGREKGIPGGIAPFRLGDIGAKGWNLLAEDLPLPVAVLKDAALIPAVIEHDRWAFNRHAAFRRISGGARSRLPAAIMSHS